MFGISEQCSHGNRRSKCPSCEHFRQIAAKRSPGHEFHTEHHGACAACQRERRVMHARQDREVTLAPMHGQAGVGA